MREATGFTFNQFSHDYHDEPVTVELLVKEVGMKSIARHMPLLGIMASTDNSGGIAIVVGDARQDRLACHIVQQPMHVVAGEADGRQTSLLIDSAAGPVTLVNLREPLRGRPAEAKGDVRPLRPSSKET